MNLQFSQLAIKKMKKESNRAKGNRLEKEFMRMMEVKGYFCERAKYVKYQSNDLFGAFDLMGFNHIGGFFAQVKANQCRSERTKLKEFRLKFPPNIEIILAVKYEDYGPKEWLGKWRIEEIT